ncbi:MAG: hypothetical protein JXR43_08690, partial [Burkholderiaceae bacterium]|nr:hypothetical protein [Burkholderiaceae bacterium]
RLALGDDRGEGRPLMGPIAQETVLEGEHLESVQDGYLHELVFRPARQIDARIIQKLSGRAMKE